MAEYLPPTENVPIFDTLNFKGGDEPLTFNTASKSFLRYPYAQGTENLQAINVSGLATMSSIISTVGNSITLADKNTNLNFNYIVSGVTRYIRQYINTSNRLIWDYWSGTTTTTLLTVNGTTSTSWSTPILSTATVPATSDSSTRVPTTAWVQSVISGITPSTALTPSSVTITPVVGSYQNANILNQWNSGGQFSFTGSTIKNWNGSSSGLVQPSTTPQIKFIPNSFTTVNPLLYGCEFEINFFFWNTNNGNRGQTTCNLVLFPYAVKGVGVFPYVNSWYDSTLDSTTSLPNGYDINNQINNNGQDAVNYTNATYCPNGRQYWTYNQLFSGLTGANAYLNGIGNADTSFSIYINFLMPSANSADLRYSITIKTLNTNGANTTSPPLGVYVGF